MHLEIFTPFSNARRGSPAFAEGGERMPVQLYPMRVRWTISLASFVVVAGCDVAAQPDSAKPVAAFEVQLQSEADRYQFLTVLRVAAEAQGMHVDAASRQELQRRAKAIPEAEMTMHAAVWRGSTDDDAVAVAMDQQDHLGQVWIVFLRGEDPVLANTFRQRVMHEIMRRWPSTLSLPIMPTGALPLHRDLVPTPTGYVVNPSEARRYSLDEATAQRH